MVRRSNSTKIGLKAIAERAGVSVATVSLALSDHPNVNDATKERVQALSRELGYVTAEDLATRRARRKVERIGFVTVGAELHDGHATFIEPLAREVTDWNMQLDTHPILAKDEAEIIEKLLAYGVSVDALLITDDINIAIMKALDTLQKPCLAFGYIADSNADVDLLTHTRVVAPNDTGMSRWTTCWLFRRGHKRVGFLAPNLRPGASDDRQHDGWRLACLDAGQVPVAADLYITAHRAKRKADGSFADPIGPNVPRANPAEVAAFFLDQDEPPSAYYVSDPRLGRAFLDGCKARGVTIAPENLVVRGPRFQIQRAKMLKHPFIEMDPSLMARTAAAILARPDRRVLAEGIYILFPLPIHNFA